MHKNDLKININIVRNLINEQFPKYSNLPINQLNSRGTVNYIFKLGQELYIRLPRMRKWSNIEKEYEVLSYLAPNLSLEIPEVIAVGEPDDLYPLKWAIYKWIKGSTYSDKLISDEIKAAKDLANFIKELKSIAIPTGAPKAGRKALGKLNEKTLKTIYSADNLSNKDKIIRIWKESLKAVPWDGKEAWIHSDLLRTNLLIQSGNLNAVIDFGSAGIGDPAFDLIPAWTVFNSGGREIFKNCINADRESWIRARGYALHQAVLIIPYYKKSNPEFTLMAQRTLNEILADYNLESRN
jgi:aminoglycoside phosphotransferase (APT) family kinase protein